MDQKPKQSMFEKDYQEPAKKRFCMKHPTAYWGSDQWGNPYTRCAVGHRVNEECVEGGE